MNQSDKLVLRKALMDQGFHDTPSPPPKLSIYLAFLAIRCFNPCMKSVYIETTIPSFYHETRDEAMFAAMRQWTREWWSEEGQNYDCFTSDAVINEIECGDHPEKVSKLGLLENVPLLDITWEIEEIVEVYISNYLMPKDELGDALHLAIASFHKMDFLLTWNCKHLANANKRDHIRRINERLKLFTPELVTPLELTGE